MKRRVKALRHGLLAGISVAVCQELCLLIQNHGLSDETAKQLHVTNTESNLHIVSSTET